MVDNKADSLESKPLGLTVYDLPEPGAVADADARQTASGRVRMLLVLLVCAAPVIASYLTFYVLRPQSLLCAANVPMGLRDNRNVERHLPLLTGEEIETEELSCHR